LVQEARFLNYWKFGGREKKFPVGSRVEDAKDGVKEGVQKAKEAVKA
jgi:hypothetical protein